MSVWLICDLSCCIEESWLLASLLFGVRNGSMVKGWGLGPGDPGSIPFTGTHFWICCGVPFILPRTLQNGAKNVGGPLCLQAQHTVERSTSSQIVANFGRDGYRAWFEYYGLCCTLESITLSELKTWHRILSPRHLCIFYCVLKIWYIAVEFCCLWLTKYYWRSFRLKRVQKSKWCLPNKLYEAVDFGPQ